MPPLPILPKGAKIITTLPHTYEVMLTNVLVSKVGFTVNMLIKFASIAVSFGPSLQEGGRGGGGAIGLQNEIAIKKLFANLSNGIHVPRLRIPPP